MNRQVASGNEVEAAGAGFARVERNALTATIRKLAAATRPIVSVLRPGLRAVFSAANFSSENDCWKLRCCAKSRSR